MLFSEKTSGSEGIRERPRQATSILKSSPSKPPLATPRMWLPEDEVIADSEEEPMNGYDAHPLDSSVIVISSDSEEDVPLSRSNDPFIDNGTHGFAGGTSGNPPNTKKGKACAPRHPVTRKRDSDVIYVGDTDEDSPDPFPSISLVKAGILQRTLIPYAPILDSLDLNLNSDDSDSDSPVSLELVPRGPSRSSMPALTTPSTPKSPRKPRKLPEEQMKLQAYTKTLFDELNAAVFQGKLSGTELVWSVRLLTTAGRATQTRKKNDPSSRTLKIELATKVVDCPERVRNTLAHEMCHVAVWVLDGNPREGPHGPHFKAWSNRVTKVRPDIIISTRHSYGIKYKYQWRCTDCGTVYSRHSKSINVETSFCIRHDTPGRLEPLFEQPARRTPRSANANKLAPAPPQMSLGTPARLVKPAIKPKTTAVVCTDLTKEDDLDELIKGLGGVSLIPGD